MRNAFLTPNATSLSGVSVRRFFSCPVGLLPYLTGAVCELTRGHNWERFGDAPIDLVIESFEDVIASMADMNPIGTIYPTIANEKPDFSLWLDGAVVDVADYVGLANAIPSWVSGGSIELPDMGDSYLVGGSGVLGMFVGENQHTLTLDEVPPHAHDYVGAVGSVSTVVVPDEPSAVPSPMLSSVAGGGLPHNNMPKSLTVRWYVIAK